MAERRRLPDPRRLTLPRHSPTPGNGPRGDLGPGFGAVASSRTLTKIGRDAPVEALAEAIRQQDALLAEGVVPIGPYAEVAAPDGSGARLRLEPLSPSIGTVVHGLDLRRPLGDATVAFLRALWLERKVLFFRQPDWVLSRSEHEAFSAQFGLVGANFGEPLLRGDPAYNDAPLPQFAVMRSGPRALGVADSWHSDASWMKRPPMGSVLLCHEAPPIGGNTYFCDAYAMYEGLSEDTKVRLATGGPGGGVMMARHRATFAGGQGWIHPCLRTHPETGRTGLFVSPQFTEELLPSPLTGASECARLLSQCWATADRPEFACGFRWARGSIAMWDNRSCLHYGSGDYWPHTRRLERLCLVDFQEERREPYYLPPAASPDRGGAGPVRGYNPDPSGGPANHSRL